MNLNENNLVTSWWTDFVIMNQTMTVEEPTRTSQSNEAVVGDTINLACQATRAYEYCTWRHNGKECKFEWKRVR